MLVDFHLCARLPPASACVHSIDSFFRWASGVPGKAGGAARAELNLDAIAVVCATRCCRARAASTSTSSSSWPLQPCPIATWHCPPATARRQRRQLHQSDCDCSVACVAGMLVVFATCEHAVSLLAALCATVRKVIVSHGQPACGLCTLLCGLVTHRRRIYTFVARELATEVEREISFSRGPINRVKTNPNKS